MSVVFGTLWKRLDKTRAHCYRAKMRAPNALRDLPWALAGSAAALVPCAFMWGFTVDDALISVRYARHLAAGLGYRFNAAGPVTDGVTPLPWALLLAPLAHAPALDVLLRAKYMGLVAWAAAAAALGVAVGRISRRDGISKRGRPWLEGGALVAVALSLPVAAHAVSGMETGLAIACATAAALFAGHRPRACAMAAGIAAAFRPEMAPWAAVLALGVAWARVPWRALGHAGLALAPFLLCTLARLAIFGRPAPLAVLAKPSDLSHGAVYALAALIVAATPVLVLAPRALARGPRAARAIVGAGIVHVVSVIAVGGDWMPYARLMAPIVPSLAWAGVLVLPHAHRAMASARTVLALAVGALFFVRAGPAGRGVGEDRRALIASAQPYLASAKVVVALDIGWVSAATDGTIVDLAGVTDPVIAALPGGHTSKRVDAALVLSREPDVVLFYVTGGIDARSLPVWRDARYAYAVESRLARADLIAAHFEPCAFLPLGARGAGYVLLMRTSRYRNGGCGPF